MLCCIDGGHSYRHVMLHRWRAQLQACYVAQMEGTAIGMLCCIDGGNSYRHVMLHRWRAELQAFYVA